MTIGQTAPNFELADQNGKIFRLSSQLKKGGVILVFYPYDQTPSCTKQLCDVNKDIDLFTKHGLKVFGINNAEAESHRNFAERQLLHMSLLSDPQYTVSKAYDCLWQIGPISVIRRTVVGIDKSGKIVYYQRGVRSNQEVLDSFLAESNKTPSKIL